MISACVSPNSAPAVLSLSVAPLRCHASSVGDLLPGGIESHEVGVLCPDETALRIPIAGGALAIADGIVRIEDGPLMFVPDQLLGEEPDEIRRGLRAAYAWRLDLSFDHLLFAHGLPWINGGKQALREFVQS